MGSRKLPAAGMPSLTAATASSPPLADAAASGHRALQHIRSSVSTCQACSSPPRPCLCTSQAPFWHPSERCLTQAPPPTTPCPTPLPLFAPQERESFASWRSNSAPSSARPSRPSSARPSLSSRGQASVDTMTPMSGATNEWDQRPSADTPLPGAASSGYKGGWVRGWLGGWVGGLVIGGVVACTCCVSSSSTCAGASNTCAGGRPGSVPGPPPCPTLLHHPRIPYPCRQLAG